MNERIRSLAEHLGPVATIGNWGRVEWADNIYPQLGDAMYASIDLEKFAQLIVQECVNACESHDIESFGILPIRSVMVTKSCQNNIKEHFGVEL